MFCNLGQLVLHEKEVRTTHWFSGWTLFLEELVLLHITTEPGPTCTDTSNNKLNIQCNVDGWSSVCSCHTAPTFSVYYIHYLLTYTVLKLVYAEWLFCSCSYRSRAFGGSLVWNIFAEEDG